MRFYSPDLVEVLVLVPLLLHSGLVYLEAGGVYLLTELVYLMDEGLKKVTGKMLLWFEHPGLQKLS